MPSPFPGMNPYLESPDIWEDFHQNLAGVIQRQLAPRLRPKYFAALVPKVTYEEIDVEAYPMERQRVKPDVGIWASGVAEAVAAPRTAILAPPIVETIAQEFPLKLWTVEIRETGHKNLITSIEILSPVNKRPGHEAYSDYQRKRLDLMRAGVNLLEIDLLRAGRRPPQNLSKPLPPAPYFAFLWRVVAPTQQGIYPFSLREPIPILPVPLREPDPDAPLDLSLAIQTIYDEAAYDLRIDYSQPPPKPDFPLEDATWIQQQVASFA